MPLVEQVLRISLCFQEIFYIRLQPQVSLASKYSHILKWRNVFQLIKNITDKWMHVIRNNLAIIKGQAGGMGKLGWYWSKEFVMKIRLLQFVINTLCRKKSRDIFHNVRIRYAPRARWWTDFTYKVSRSVSILQIL